MMSAPLRASWIDLGRITNCSGLLGTEGSQIRGISRTNTRTVLRNEGS